MARLFKKNKEISTYQKAFCLTVMAIALIMVLTSNHPLISRQGAEVQLKAFQEYVAGYAKEGEANATFSYTDIAIEGFGQRAVVTKPSISVANAAVPDAPPTLITTERMIIIPVHEADANYVIQFPDPLIITDAVGQVTQVSFEGMPAYSYGFSKENDVSVLHQSVYLPSKVILASRQASATPPAPSTESETPDQAETPVASAGEFHPSSVITFSPDPVISSVRYQDGRSEGQVSFQNIQVSDIGGKPVLSIGSINATTRHATPAEGRLPFETTMTLADIGLKNDETQQGPFTVKLNVAGSRAAVEEGKPVHDMDMEVREFSLSSDAYVIRASGNVSRKPEDTLPFGKLDVTISHFGALRDSKMVSAEVKPLLVSVFNRITGSDVSAMDDVQFNLTREKLGNFVVGKATFEEIAALVLSHIVAGAPPAPVQLTPPSAPAASAPSR